MKTKFLFLSVMLVCAQLLSAQVFNAFVLMAHGAGCTDDAGKLFVTTVGGNNPTYLWSTGATTDTISGLGAGTYSVTAISGIDTVIRTVTLHPFGPDTIYVRPACHGVSEGSIYLNNFEGKYPITYDWFFNNALLNQHSAQADSLGPGIYTYRATDAEACVDSGIVEVKASSPTIQAYLGDSSLCYNGITLVWFSPGFTLYDGVSYFSSNIDTFSYTNQLGGGNNVPLCGMDSVGCEACVDELPFIYRQGHPDAMTLYHFTDTLSTIFGISHQYDSNHVYHWYYQGQFLDSTHYTYLAIDTSGFYSVIRINQFGCSNSGSIQAFYTALSETGLNTELEMWPIPFRGAVNVRVPQSMLNTSYEVYDVYGKRLIKGTFDSVSTVWHTPNWPSGIYFLKTGNQTLLCIKN